MKFGKFKWEDSPKLVRALVNARARLAPKLQPKSQPKPPSREIVEVFVSTRTNPELHR